MRKKYSADWKLGLCGDALLSLVSNRVIRKRMTDGCLSDQVDRTILGNIFTKTLGIDCGDINDPWNVLELIDDACQQYLIHGTVGQANIVNKKVTQIESTIERARELRDSLANFDLQDRCELGGDFIERMEEDLIELGLSLKKYREKFPDKPMQGGKRNDSFDELISILCNIFIENQKILDNEPDCTIDDLVTNCIRFVTTILCSYGIEDERAQPFCEIPALCEIPKEKSFKFSRNIKNIFLNNFNSRNHPTK